MTKKEKLSDDGINLNDLLSVISAPDRYMPPKNITALNPESLQKNIEAEKASHSEVSQHSMYRPRRS